jgi:putative membrane protein
MMWEDGFHGWGGFGGGLMMLVYWAVLILIVIALARWAFGARGSRGGPEAGRRDEAPALEILEQRYARGEIGRDEFEQKKRDLQT